jgi:hypothetical protein
MRRVCAGASAPVLVVVVCAVGCAGASFDPPPPPPFKFAVLVEGDPGKPIEGATVQKSSTVLGKTAANGRAEMELKGADGDVVDADVKCPDGFQSPNKPISVRLARTSATPEYKITCPPAMRHVVLAIKTENGPNLPVVYLGKVVAKTDVSGAAHVAIDLPPGAQFSVALDTTDAPKIKPQMPNKPFTVGQSDDIYVWEQRFDVEKKKLVVAKVKIPQRLGGGV